MIKTFTKCVPTSKHVHITKPNHLCITIFGTIIPSPRWSRAGIIFLFLIGILTKIVNNTWSTKRAQKSSLHVAKVNLWEIHDKSSQISSHGIVLLHRMYKTPLSLYRYSASSMKTKLNSHTEWYMYMYNVGKHRLKYKPDCHPWVDHDLCTSSTYAEASWDDVDQLGQHHPLQTKNVTTYNLYICTLHYSSGETL